MIDSASPEFGRGHPLPDPMTWIGRKPSAIADGLRHRSDVAILGGTLSAPSGWPATLVSADAVEETVRCFGRTESGAVIPFLTLPVSREPREDWCFVFGRVGDSEDSPIEPVAAVGIRDGVAFVVRDLRGFVASARNSAELARWLGLDPPSDLRRLHDFTARCRSSFAPFVLSRSWSNLRWMVSMFDRPRDESIPLVDVDERGLRVCGEPDGASLAICDVWGGRLPVRFVDESGTDYACALVAIENYGIGATVRIDCIAHEARAGDSDRWTGGHFLRLADGDLSVVDRDGLHRKRALVRHPPRRPGSDSPFMWWLGQIL